MTVACVSSPAHAGLVNRLGLWILAILLLSPAVFKVRVMGGFVVHPFVLVLIVAWGWVLYASADTFSPTQTRVVLSRMADVEYPADSAGALDRRIGAEPRHQFHSTGIAPIDRLAALAEMGALPGPASADDAAGAQDRLSGRQTGQLPDPPRWPFSRCSTRATEWGRPWMAGISTPTSMRPPPSLRWACLRKSCRQRAWSCAPTPGVTAPTVCIWLSHRCSVFVWPCFKDGTA
jgi:hypothetical protein